MLQRFFGVSIGAIITFLLLLFFITVRTARGGSSATRTRPTSGRPIIGAVASFFWPIVIGWFLVRRHRQRQQNQVQAEVERQMAEQQKPGG